MRKTRIMSRSQGRSVAVALLAAITWLQGRSAMFDLRRFRWCVAAGGAVTVIAALGAAAAPASASAKNPASWVATATRATSIRGAVLTGDAPGSATVSLAVTLKPRHAAAEEAALRAMYKPGSPAFRKFLTPAQWESAYAPTRGQVDAVKKYLRDSGLTGLAVQGDRLLITADGTVADASRAFGTTIGEYKMPDGGTFRANITAAEVPAVWAPFPLALSAAEVPTVWAPSPPASWRPAVATPARSRSASRSCLA